MTRNTTKICDRLHVVLEGTLNQNPLDCTENPSQMDMSNVIRKRKCYVFNLICKKRLKNAQYARDAQAQPTAVKMAPSSVTGLVCTRDASVAVLAGNDEWRAIAAGQLQDAAPGEAAPGKAAPAASESPLSPKRPPFTRRSAGQKYPAKSISNRALMLTPVQKRTVQNTPADAPRAPAALVPCNFQSQPRADMLKAAEAQKAYVAAVQQQQAASETPRGNGGAGYQLVPDVFDDVIAHMKKAVEAQKTYVTTVQQQQAASETPQGNGGAEDQLVLDFFDDVQAGENVLQFDQDDMDTDLQL